MTKGIFPGYFLNARPGVLVALAILLAFIYAPSSEAQAPQVQVVSRFGQAQVNGQDVIVHVTVAVPRGANPDQVTLNALGDQGARPFQGDEFSTTGLVWNQFSDSDGGNDQVIQNYNPANDPTAGGLTPLLNSQFTWTNVPTSKFALQPGDLGTTRCPSLVKECKGPQTFDGFNDVAWLPIRGCCTLAVTWSSSSTDEADMAINTNFSWSTTGGGDYDLESVILHENGHVAGLGHSEIAEAVMYAYYSGERRALHEDDVEGITFLYPADGSTGTISGNVRENGGSFDPISGATVSVGVLSAITDDSGNYAIDVPAGDNYDVTASASGFFSKTESGVIVTAESLTPTNVDFSLDRDLNALEISAVSSEKAGKGGTFKITWTTNKPADSEVTFTCCGAYSDSALVTDHGMNFRGNKGAVYEYWVKSTDASGNSVEAGPFVHNN